MVLSWKKVAVDELHHLRRLLVVVLLPLVKPKRPLHCILLPIWSSSAVLPLLDISHGCREWWPWKKTKSKKEEKWSSRRW